MRRVYLDHIAATPLDPEAVQAMLPYLGEKFGNPQSLHSRGQECLEAIEKARSEVSALIGAGDGEVFLASSGSEANNFAVKGIALARREKGCHLVLSAIEHQSVLHSAKSLEKFGFSSTRGVDVGITSGIPGRGSGSGLGLGCAVDMDCTVG